MKTSSTLKFHAKHGLKQAQLGWRTAEMATNRAWTTVVSYRDHCNQQSNQGMCCHLANMIEWSDNFQSKIWWPCDISWRYDLPFWHHG